MFGKKKSTARAERIVILYQGAEPNPGEIQQLVQAYAAGAELEGVRVTTYGVHEASRDLALAAVAKLEGDNGVSPNALGRTVTQTFETAKGPVVVAGVWRENALPASLRRKG